ncbi:YihY/virulence factor BrkB family protein [Pseudovibrio sp. Tun.PSC04-5.I4]|uniref:YihY/virulence factor BrkB family protein n=1 Tax=Pseudovibrio sp. Tun.PSC04-5.I4 TaxID=1798213 RepID=UPI000892498B|nr:YihY/virulence factor BrkB family protein [Pseudovibrio sp. Tun.PSC04-5.I4]SDR29170.1 membrane protein [Pseudovibrio sp. Tun.PSC04-5.I4]
MKKYGLLRKAYQVIADAVGHFNSDDGYAVASHVALSSLMALFPFIIFVAAFSGFLGLTQVAQGASDLIFDVWPKQVAGPVSGEINAVLTQPRGDLLTFGVVVTLWFSSNGVEAMRVGLNRAYRQKDTRSWYFCRAQSILAVLVGTAVLMISTFLIVFGPLAWEWVVHLAPVMEQFSYKANIVRYGVTSLLLLSALLAAHLYLPAGNRRFWEVLPGIILTMILWIVAGAAFGAYLARYANYVSLYAGLAGIMTAIIFMYLTAVIFILGGEFNAALMRVRRVSLRTVLGSSENTE